MDGIRPTVLYQSHKKLRRPTFMTDLRHVSRCLWMVYSFYVQFNTKPRRRGAGSLNVTPGQEVAKHTNNIVFKYQHEQAAPLAVLGGVVTAECGSVDLWAHSMPYRVVYSPNLGVSRSHLARWLPYTPRTLYSSTNMIRQLTLQLQGEL